MDQFVRMEKALLIRVAATLTSIGTPGCRSLAAEVVATIEADSETPKSKAIQTQETTPAA